jgi:hypothetical protein
MRGHDISETADLVRRLEDGGWLGQADLNVASLSCVFSSTDQIGTDGALNCTLTSITIEMDQATTGSV